MNKNQFKRPSATPLFPSCSESRIVSVRPKQSNITAERLTLLPAFLARGAKSSSTSSSAPDNGDTSVKPRRSWRLCKNNQPLTISEYFNQLVSESDRDKSKFGKTQEPLDDGFEKRLFKKLHNFKLKDSVVYQKKISEDIDTINNILTGKPVRKMSLNRKRAYNEEEKENYLMKFPYVPQAKWVFQTPPNRKLHYNHVHVDSGIKPAVIETRDDGNVVYELNRKFKMDLTGFSNRQEIDIDKRFMLEPNFGEHQPQDVLEDKIDFLQSGPFELENHFLSLTCRPKKVASALPRFNILKRKRDIFEPQPGCSTDSEQPNVCFLDSLNLNSVEESFTFKFTSSDSVAGPTTGHLFDYEGNKKNSFNFHF